MRWMIGLSAAVLMVIWGCGGGGGPLLADYNTVYGVNAVNGDDNISLHAGDEVIETVTPYEENASVIEKALGRDILAYYSVGAAGDYGLETLVSDKTYFYAATDCNDSSAVTHRDLLHIVEDDTQIKIVNTSSTPLSAIDINISIDGNQINGNLNACSVTAMLETSAADQNISVAIGGSTILWKVLPAAVSADIIIYDAVQQKAAIVPLPRLTPDAIL